MTIVYGVTRIGGRKQIEVNCNGYNCAVSGKCVFLFFFQKQLKTYNIDEDSLWECSNYVTGLVFESLKEMFFNARSIQVHLSQLRD